MITTAMTLAIVAGFPVICLALIVWIIKRRETRDFLDREDDWGAW